MKIKFCGAAAGVTGSCHMITTDGNKLLLDCGQFQGGKAMDALNFEEFPFNPSEIDFVILSHAHIDHCGRIPLLVKRGFRGKIYCTDATADLLEVMLKDSGYIHEKEAEWKNKKAARTNKETVEPLYTVNDAVDSLKYVVPVLYDQLIELNEKIKFVFNDAGHILGSAIIELWVEENDNVSTLVFSGDIGVMDRPLLRNPTIIKSAYYLIMETTYGNRLHPENATSIEELMKIIFDTTKRGGTVVIPSFAVGRTQELIFELKRLDENHKIIISASGMCEAGRIRHHLKHNLWNKKNSIIFVGYQAEGTLGRLIVEGIKDVTLFGEEIHVNAEIHNLEGFSGHADREGLLTWISGFKKQPKQVFFVHGELEAKHSFADLVKQKINLDSIVVEGFSEFEMTNSDIVNREQSMKEAMNDEVLMGVKLKIAKIHDDLETILNNTRLAMAQDITSDKLSAINNSVLELEKSTVNLGAAVTKGENNNI